jgi:UDP-glucose 4-epimerase
MILVTGGAGYIGSHMVVVLQQHGFEVVILDNFSNSKPEVINRIEKITGQRPHLVEGDTRDTRVLSSLFSSYRINTVIHFAGLKAVGESVANPLKYYENNVQGSLNLLHVMSTVGCKRIIFSSSATVYGDPISVPIKEDFALSATNPYGQSKLMLETILGDLATSDSAWQIALLRYFNPVGAHSSGLIGEDPNGIPNNLVPYVAKVASGSLEAVQVFGNDYATEDGTGVRDYIHIMDLVDGHLKAMGHLSPSHGCQAYNLGTGVGYSVLQVINTFSQVSGQVIPYEIVGRRPGDIAQCYADPTLSAEQLNWQANYNLESMVKDHWHWQQKNPSGYDKS